MSKVNKKYFGYIIIVVFVLVVGCENTVSDSIKLKKEIQNAAKERSDKQQISEKAKAVFGLEKTASGYLKVYTDLFNNKA